MISRAIRTPKVEAGTCTIFELMDEALAELSEQSVVAVSSKVVSLCEGRIRPIKGTDLQALVRKEAEWYMPMVNAQHGYTFTVAQNMLTPNSGIDESNAGGVYVLWPADPWASANGIRKYLMKRFGVKEVAVVITDSNFLPLRWGAVGMALAYSGLKPVRSYSEEADLFGRPLKLTRVNVIDSLATTAVFLMGEGAEQTPLAVMEELEGRVVFVPKDPAREEIEARRTPLDEDSFGPLLTGVKWLPGGAKDSR